MLKARKIPVQPEDESVRLVPLTQGKFAIVDAADYGAVMQFHWCAIRMAKIGSKDAAVAAYRRAAETRFGRFARAA